MALKEIQLRGISHSPSARMTKDGGVAESMNTHIINGETAAVLQPKNIGSTYHGDKFAAQPLYIHKGINYNNMLFLAPNNTIKARKSEVSYESTILTLAQDETIVSVKGIGNTVIVCTNKRMEYLLFKDGAYKDLGSQIPIPKIEFRTDEGVVTDYTPGNLQNTFFPYKYNSYELDDWTEATSYASRHAGQMWETSGRHGYQSSSTSRVAPEGLKRFDISTWNAYLNNDKDSQTLDEEYAEINNHLWELVKGQMALARKKEYLPCPVFVRYALRLYDGTYINQSVPILIGAGTKEFFTAGGHVRYISGSGYKSFVDVRLKRLYRSKAYLSPINFSGWEDIVKSIDIFMSTEICYPFLTSKITGIDITAESEGSECSVDFTLQSSEDTDIEEERIREEILSKSQFYQIASFRINNVEKLVNGYSLVTKDLPSVDALIEQPELTDDFRSNHSRLAKDTFQYNNRLFLVGYNEIITSGYPFMNGSIVSGNGLESHRTQYHYSYRFYLRDSSNNTLTVLGRNPANGTVYSPTYSKEIRIGSQSVQEYENYSRPYGWIAYPDSRCYKVDIMVQYGSTTIYRSYTMESHPYLNCSFAFIGLDKAIGLEEGTQIFSFSTTEKRESHEDNVFWASVMNNPFVFTASGRMTYHSELISLATVTKPLSEGQVGQFPIYVFTKDGIWSVPITDTGTFAANVAVSQDVALSKNAISPLEQSVVFVSKQGVMLLQGGSVTSISPYMVGEETAMSDEIIGVISRHPQLSGYASVYDNQMSFLQYVSEAVLTYDYANRRVLFFRPDAPYCFTYQLDTQTWHKLSFEGMGIRLHSALNSYPDCYICCKDKETSNTPFSLYDFSVRYGQTLPPEEQTLPGFILTRAFDLEEPDKRKTIRSIRIRGVFNRNDVQYMLLGSFDGIHWQWVRSMRGGSYRMFRMLIFCNMEPGERVSWVDVDYETRYGDKIR